MGFYVQTDKFIDKFTDSGFLTERVPTVANSLVVAKNWRDFHEETGKHGWVGPELQHVASIDPNIGVVAMDLEWSIFETPKKFYAWLRKHPECRVDKKASTIK